VDVPGFRSSWTIRPPSARARAVSAGIVLPGLPASFGERPDRSYATATKVVAAFRSTPPSPFEVVLTLFLQKKKEVVLTFTEKNRHKTI